MVVLMPGILFSNRQAKVAGELNIVDTMEKRWGQKMGKTAIIFWTRVTKVGMASDLFNESDAATSILNEAQAQLNPRYLRNNV